jgi:hypothetical protein
MEFERGFHGWLVLFFAGSCLAAVLRGLALFRTGAELRLAVNDHDPSLLLTVLALVVIRAILFAATIVGLALFAKASTHTPDYFALLLLGSVLANGLLFFLNVREGALLNGGAFAADLWSRFGESELRAAAVALVWALYWMRSVRVRLTFGRNAFSPRPAPTVQAAAQAT